MAYPMRRRGIAAAEAKAEARRILTLLHIGQLADRRPGELSGGEQQRVGLARALARQASLYLFDEPTAHLDTHVRGVFLDELVARRSATGAAALYATHDAEEALGLADRVALLNGGRLVQVGSPQEVYDQPVDLWAAQLTGPTSVLDVRRGRARCWSGPLGLGSVVTVPDGLRRTVRWSALGLPAHHRSGFGPGSPGRTAAAGGGSRRDLVAGADLANWLSADQPSAAAG